MMNKTIIALLSIVCVASFVGGLLFENTTQNEKISFLEEKLEERNIEYEWLSKVANRIIVLYNETNDFQLPDHLLNTDYSVEKCDELIEIGFYAYVSDSLDEEEKLYEMCIETANHINRS